MNLVNKKKDSKYLQYTSKRLRGCNLLLHFCSLPQGQAKVQVYMGIDYAYFPYIARINQIPYE